MKKVLLVCAALAAMTASAPAQQLPRLSEFLTSCNRDTYLCRNKVRDYLTAAESQKVICRPAGQSMNESVSEMLRWLRSEDTHPESLKDQPYDDALYEASLKLFPCKPAEPPPAPAPAPAPQQ